MVAASGGRPAAGRPRPGNGPGIYCASYNQGADMTSVEATAPRAQDVSGLDTEFTRGLGLYDATMVVVGSMIGSGIFIVSADMARLVGSPGWLLLAWLVTGVLTVTA